MDLTGEDEAAAGDSAGSPDDEEQAASARSRLKDRLAQVVDAGIDGARASRSVFDAGVDVAKRAGTTAIGAGAEQAQRAGELAKETIDRIRDDDDDDADETELAVFAPLWPDASEHDERRIAAKVLAEKSSDAVIEDVLTIASLALGGAMAEWAWQDDEDVSTRIGVAIQPRIVSLNQAANQGDPFNLDAVLTELGGHLSGEQRTAVLLDLWFIDPFAPYQIKVRRRVRDGALGQVAESLGLQESELDALRGTVREARNAHTAGSLKRMALFGVGGVLLVGAAGFLAAPALATAIGTASGLSGAAATSYGLAVLGGGTLAAGGAGMTGGLWLVAGAGGVLGLTGGAGGRAMFELGVNQLRIEVVKLQVSYKFLLLDRQIDTAKAQTVMAALAKRIEELRERIEIEKAINDKNSDRVSDLEEKLTMLISGQQWMKDQELTA